MEQFIILIIIYVLYALFTNIMRKAKEQQRPTPPGQRPARPVPGPSPGQAPRPVAETPEVEIPPFLREMLGLDKPQPLPPPEPVEVPEEFPAVVEEPPKPKMPSIPERIPASVKMEADEIEDLSRPFPTIGVKTKGKIQGLLGSNENLRNAFILKEILDAPVSRRSRRFPFSGRP